MKKTLTGLLVTLGLVLSGLAGIASFAAPAAQAADCSGQYALCMFANANKGGAMLTGSKAVCGYYSDLRNQGFNDVTSSIDNWVGNTQSFWKDMNQGGSKMTISPWGYIANLDGTGWNDVISSVVWTG